jgi:hypothetical protein
VAQKAMREPAMPRLPVRVWTMSLAKACALLRAGIAIVITGDGGASAVIGDFSVQRGAARGASDDEPALPGLASVK